MSHRPATQPLCPLPRVGIQGLRGVILFAALIIASFFPSLAVASLGGHSPLPTSAIEAIALAALILEGFYLSLRQKKKARGLLPLLIVMGVLLTAYTRSILPAAAFISFLFVLAEGAVLLAVANKRQLMLIPLLPLATFAIAALTGGQLLYGVIGLLPYPAMAALALATRRAAAKKDGLTRVGTICLTSATFGASIIGVVIYLIYTVQGALDLTVLSSVMDETREALLALLNQLASGAGGSLSETLTPEVINDLIDSLFNLLPAYGVLACNLLATLAQMMLLSELSDVYEALPDRLKSFSISIVSCAVFIVSYAILLFSSSGDVTVSVTVAENLIFILTPALAWAGILHISFNLTRRGRVGCAPLLLMLVPCLLFIAPWIPAFYEAFYTVTAPIRFRKKPPHDNP